MRSTGNRPRQLSGRLDDQHGTERTAFPVNHVTQATDNLGRTVTYTYNANGTLATVTDPEQTSFRPSVALNHERVDIDMRK